jgi:hypothetical protein
LTKLDSPPEPFPAILNETMIRSNGKPENNEN